VRSRQSYLPLLSAYPCGNLRPASYTYRSFYDPPVKPIDSASAATSTASHTYRLPPVIPTQKRFDPPVKPTDSVSSTTPDPPAIPTGVSPVIPALKKSFDPPVKPTDSAGLRQSQPASYTYRRLASHPYPKKSFDPPVKPTDSAGFGNPNPPVKPTGVWPVIPTLKNPSTRQLNLPAFHAERRQVVCLPLLLP
jgi:hypothetical protein